MAFHGKARKPDSIKDTVHDALEGYPGIHDTPEGSRHNTLATMVYEDRFNNRTSLLEGAMQFLVFRYGQMAIANYCIRTMQLKQPVACKDFDPEGLQRLIGADLFASYSDQVDYAASRLFPPAYKPREQRMNFMKPRSCLIATLYQSGIAPTEVFGRLYQVWELVEEEIARL